MISFEILQKEAEQDYHEGYDSQVHRKSEQLLIKNPDHAEAIIYFAEIAIRKKQFQKAQSLLLRAIEKQPFETNLHFHLANTWLALGQEEQAIVYFLRTLTLNPQHAKAYNNLGRVFHKKKDFSKAYTYYQKAIQCEPKYTEALCNLGLLFISTNQLQEAKQQFESILRSHQEITFVYEQLAQLAWRTHDLETAFNYYQQLLERQPTDSDTWNNLGALLLQMQENAKAVEAFKKALTYNSKHIHARSNLAALYLQQHQLKESIWEYTLYLRLNPKDFEAHYNLGVALMLSGQLKEAVPAFQATIALKNASAVEAWANLGAIYVRTQNLQKAYDSYREVIKLEPNHAIGQFMLNALSQSPDCKNMIPMSFKHEIPKQAPLIYIKNLFDNYAGYFDQHLTKTLRYQIPQQIYHLMAPYLKDRKHYAILDLGCGTGLSSAVFQSLDAVITGVDISTQMLAKAKQKNIYHQLIEMDIVSFLEQCQQFYDVILCVDTLVYFGELLPLLQKINSIVQPMAYFAFSIETLSQKIENEKKSDPYYHLQVSGRYQHCPEAVLRLAQEYGWHCLQQSSIQGRLHNHQYTDITLLILQKKV